MVTREGAPTDGRYNAWCGCCDTVAIGAAGALLEAGWTPSAGATWWYCPNHQPTAGEEKKWWEPPVEIGPNTFRAMFEPFPLWVGPMYGEEDLELAA